MSAQSELEKRVEAITVERDRQTQLLTTAIEKAIIETGKQIGPMPMLNAVAGALACSQAHVLCSVPAGKARKALREAMDRTLAKAIRTYEGQVKQSEVVKIGELQ